MIEAGFVVRKLAEECGGGEGLRHTYCIADLVTYGKGIHPNPCTGHSKPSEKMSNLLIHPQKPWSLRRSISSQ
jgi:hypothetical protein